MKSAFLLPAAIAIFTIAEPTTATGSTCRDTMATTGAACAPGESTDTGLTSLALPAPPAKGTAQDQGASVSRQVLLAQSANPLSDAARSQRSIMEANAQLEQRELRVSEVKRRLAERNLVITKEIYYAAKAAGVRMAPVSEELDKINVGRRNSGVWALTIAQQIDGPYLVMVGNFTDRTPQFAVQGAGLYGLRGFLQDNDFERTGVFSPTCAYEVSMGDSPRKYPCEDYLSGKVHSKVVEDMKASLASSLAARQRLNSGQR